MVEFTKAELRELARLAAKHGRRSVAETVMDEDLVPLPTKGRPRTHWFDARGAMAETAVIELLMGRYAERGSRHQFEDAARLLYWWEKGGRKGDEDWKRWLKNLKHRFYGRNRAMLQRQIEEEWDQ